VTTSVKPPEEMLHMPRLTEKFVELFCNLPRVGLLTSLSYNLVLVALCTFYAFRTRQLPDNYNESRYIAFCVNTTLLIWITFIPTYFTTSRAAAKTTILAVSLLLNAYVTLICLFIPRVHTLYYSLKDKRLENPQSYVNFRIVKHVVVRNGSGEAKPKSSVSSCSRRQSGGVNTLTSRDRDLTDDIMDINERPDEGLESTLEQQNRNCYETMPSAHRSFTT